jgi:hypothetical protein
MGGALSKPKAEARRKGLMAAAGWATTGLFGLAALVSTWSWFWPLAGAGVSGWLTWRWFRHRATWGMRF